MIALLLAVGLLTASATQTGDDRATAPADVWSPKGTDWTTFHGNNARTGLTSANATMRFAYYKWTARTGGYILSSPAVVDTQNISVGAYVVIGSSDNRLYALNGLNGSVRWRYQASAQVFSAPSIGDINSDGRPEVVFGSDDARIWALDLYNGSLLWRYTTRSTIHGSPAIADINSDGRQEIVATCFDGNVYALNGDGTRLWMTTPSAGSRPIQASPAVGDINNDGRPEVVISTLEGMAYALAGADGKPLWNHTMGYTEKDYTALVPVITDLDGDGKAEVLVAGGLSGNLSCLSGQNGNLKWNRTLGQHLYSTPAVGDGDGDGRMEVYLFSGPMHFVALNGATGMGDWDHQFPTSVMDYSSPAMADIDGDGRPELVFGGVDRVLRALNAEDGSIAWAYPVPRRIESSPAISDIDRDGRAEVVFGCDDGRIYALDYNF